MNEILTKIIKGKVDILVIGGLPENASQVRFRFNRFLTYRRPHSSVIEMLNDPILGNYKPIGFLKDISETQAKELVDYVADTPGRIYSNGFIGDEFIFNKAWEALSDLVKSNIEKESKEVFTNIFLFVKC